MAQIITKPEDGRGLKQYRTFSLRPNTSTQLAAFDECNGQIYDYSDKDAGKLYLATVNSDGAQAGTEARSTKSSEDAIKSLVVILAGGIALKAPKMDGSGDYQFDLGEWVKNSNASEEEIVLDEAQQAELDSAAATITTAIGEARAGVSTVRVSNVKIGEALTKAKALLGREDENGKQTGVSKAAWGRWLNSNSWAMFEGKTGKNAVGEFISAAALPRDILSALNDEWTSPKTILKHVAATVKDIAGVLAERLVGKMAAKGEGKIDPNGVNVFNANRKVVSASLADYVEGKVANVEAWYAPIAAMLVADSEMVKIGREFASAWSAEVSKSDKGAQDNAAKAAAKSSAGSAVVLRGFAAFTFDEAVMHLINIASAREDGVNVLDEAAKRLEEKLTGSDAVDAEDDAAADSEADEAA